MCLGGVPHGRARQKRSKRGSFARTCTADLGGGLSDMIGQRFTRLTVVGEAPRVRGKRRWHCSCSCGGMATSYQWSLVAGRTRSCGCLRAEQLSKLQADSRHGMCGAREYKIWKLMKRR